LQINPSPSTNSDHIAVQLQPFLNGQSPLLLLIHQKKLNFKSNQTVKHINGHQIQNTTDLILLISQHTQIPCPSTDLPLSNQLENILSTGQQKNHTIFLIIDKAESLPLSVLAAISHLAFLQEGKSHLSILLTGSPTLIQQAARIQHQKIPTLIYQGQLHCRHTNNALASFIQTNNPKDQKNRLLTLANKLYQSCRNSSNAPATFSICALILSSSWIFSSLTNTSLKKTIPKKRPYHIDLLVANNYSLAAQYIKQHHLKKARIEQKIQQHHSVYVVATGHYASLINAKRALISLKKSNPLSHPHIVA
jgi:hypothetical protein